LGEVRVLRKPGAYPTGHTDASGVTVYSSTSSTPGALLVIVDSGLSPATTYFYAVYSRDQAGNWSDVTSAGVNADTGTTAAAPDTTAPAAPTGLTAADRPGDQGGTVDLAWTANPEPDVAGYHVYRALAAGGPYSRVNGTLVNGTAFADSGLANGTTYFYRITAVDASANESAQSATASATPADNLPPPAPSGLSAVDRPADEGGAVNMTWTPSTASDVTQQRVYRGTTSGGPYTLVRTITNNTTSAVTDTGLVNGTTYYYVMRAFDGTAESTNSNQSSAASIDNLAPAQVINFQASDGDNAGSTLTWTNPIAADLAQVLVKRATIGYPTGHADAGSPTVYDVTTPVPGAAISFTDSGLINGTLYGYAVYTRDQSGNWNDTTTVGLNADPGFPQNPPSGDTTPPAAPLGVTAGDRPGDQGGIVDLAWSANVEPDLAGYNVYRATSPGGPYTRLNVGLVTGTTFASAGLANGITYYYVVRAVDSSSNESAASAEVSAIPLDNLPPPAPTSLSAADRPADLGGAIALNWTLSSAPDVLQYRVYRATASGGPYTLAGPVAGTATAFVDSGLSDGTTYYYVVRAYDGTVESADSNQASAVPRSNAVEYLHRGGISATPSRRARHQRRSSVGAGVVPNDQPRQRGPRRLFHRGVRDAGKRPGRRGDDSRRVRVSDHSPDGQDDRSGRIGRVVSPSRAGAGGLGRRQHHVLRGRRRHEPRARRAVRGNDGVCAQLHEPRRSDLGGVRPVLVVDRRAVGDAADHQRERATVDRGHRRFPAHLPVARRDSVE
jgi:fibronectin type 3 domain-containing protein